MHLEPVEHTAVDGLDQIARLAPRLLERVAADESRALEHDVVELARARIVRADRADERALAQPLSAQDGSVEVVAVTTTSCSAASRWLSPGSAPVRSQNAASFSGVRQ